MRILKWLIIITVPLVLIMGSVRIFTLSWYPTWQYSRSTFPEDPLGMPQSERLRLAKACIRFLNLPHNSESLSSLLFQDGSAVFNNRELSHMDDVKVVYDRMTTAVALILILTVGYAVSQIRRVDLYMIFRAISLGGIFTTLTLIGLGIWMLVGFDVLFTAFHGVFFSEGTWLFYTTDSLIRLFPLRFWQDAGIGISLVVISCAIGLSGLGWWLARRYSPQ